MVRTVTENLQRATYTNESIVNDIRRETDKLHQEEDSTRVGTRTLDVSPSLYSWCLVDFHGFDSTTDPRRIDDDQPAGSTTRH